MPISDDTAGAIIGLKRSLLALCKNFDSTSYLPEEIHEVEGKDFDDMLEDCQTIVDTLSERSDYIKLMYQPCG